MSTLLIDAASERTIIAFLSCEAERCAMVVLEGARDHAKRLLPALDDLLKSKNLALCDITKIAVGVGPGSYTGTRIAISVAQGLAFTRSIPVIPIDSIELYSRLILLSSEAIQSASSTDPTGIGDRRSVLAIIDARMGQYYVGRLSFTASSLKPIPQSAKREDHQDFDVNAGTWSCTLASVEEAIKSYQTISSSRALPLKVVDTEETALSITGGSAQSEQLHRLSDIFARLRKDSGATTLRSLYVMLNARSTVHASKLEASYLRETIGWEKRKRIRTSPSQAHASK